MRVIKKDCEMYKSKTSIRGNSGALIGEKKLTYNVLDTYGAPHEFTFFVESEDQERAVNELLKDLRYKIYNPKKVILFSREKEPHELSYFYVVDNHNRILTYSFYTLGSSYCLNLIRNTFKILGLRIEMETLAH